MRLGSQLVLSRYRMSIVVLVLKHGSRSIEGVYLKSPEIKNMSVLTVYSIVPTHIFRSYDAKYNVEKQKEKTLQETTDKVFCFCIQTLTSVQYRAKVAFKKKHDSSWTVVGIN